MQKNQNEPQNIPNEVKAALKNMALENGLYAQVVMTRIRKLDYKTEKDIKKLPSTISKKKNIGLILIMSGWKKIS